MRLITMLLMRSRINWCFSGHGERLRGGNDWINMNFDELREKNEEKLNSVSFFIFKFQPYVLNMYLFCANFVPLLSFVVHVPFSTEFCTHTCIHIRAQSRDCICTHVHIDACVYSFDKWPLDIVRARRTRTFLFVAQFSGIDILSDVPVTSNCVVISLFVRNFRQESPMRRNGGRQQMHCPNVTVC